MYRGKYELMQRIVHRHIESLTCTGSPVFHLALVMIQNVKDMSQEYRQVYHGS